MPVSLFGFRLLTGWECSLAGEARLGWLIATAVLAVLACHFLLYDIPAMWGWTSGRRLGVVAASTFGTTGSEWVTGVGLGLGGLAFYAISIDMAIKLIMLGLLSGGLIDQDVFKPWSLGPMDVESPVIVLTAGFWIYVVTVVCRLRMANVIFALMQVYTPVAMLLLAATALLASGGLPEFVASQGSLTQLDPALRPYAGSSQARLFELVFGAFAMSGLIECRMGRGGWQSP